MNGYTIRDLGEFDPYELLGVSPAATRAEIASAYRHQVKLVHPDLSGGEEDETRLLHIARSILLDPAQRAQYDAHKRGDQGHEIPEDVIDEPSQAGQAWDSEEVIAGTAAPASPADRHPPWPGPSQYQPPHESMFHTQTAYTSPYQSYPVPPAPYGYAARAWHTPSAGKAPHSRLSIWSFVASLLCGPLGLVLGVIALIGAVHRNERRWLSIIAIIIGFSSFVTMLAPALPN